MLKMDVTWALETAFSLLSTTKLTRQRTGPQHAGTPSTMQRDEPNFKEVRPNHLENKDMPIFTFERNFTAYEY